MADKWELLNDIKNKLQQLSLSVSKSDNIRLIYVVEGFVKRMEDIIAEFATIKSEINELRADMIVMEQRERRFRELMREALQALVAVVGDFTTIIIIILGIYGCAIAHMSIAQLICLCDCVCGYIQQWTSWDFRNVSFTFSESIL
nr:hypothetical protein Iba_chr05eCG12870 [Ipomoea batatas]